ncbi:MAG: Ig-like domain-containing protein [Ferruginibacter sp.]
MGSPVFALGSTSTRCQGAGPVTFAATSTNATAISYSLDATSLAAGNTINSATGVVTFAAGWSGTSVITAVATGCSSAVSTHTVTTTPTVSAPVFALGANSRRCKGAGTATYTATASNTTGITYILDAASLSAGLTIIPATGVVTFPAAWTGNATITASAAGCGGPAVSTHVVSAGTIFAVNDDYTGNSAIENGTPGFLNILSNDLCDVDPTSISIITPPSFGDVQVDPVTGMVTYMPMGAYAGTDYFVYEVCDHGSPGNCSQAQVAIQVLPDYTNPCNEANLTKTFFLPFPENNTQLYETLYQASDNYGSFSTVVRSVTSIKVSYPGTVIYFDHWEDGYESNIAQPVQSTSRIWGDGILSNGVAPGYPTDILPAGASIVLDENFTYRPRNSSEIRYDGRDKIYTTADVAISKVTGDNATFSVQNLKSNVFDLSRYGKLFTFGLGEIAGYQYFRYAAFMITASANNTIVRVDLDNDGNIDISDTLNMGEVWFYQGQPNTIAATTSPKDILPGAVVTATEPVSVELILGDDLNFGTRNVNILPAKFYGKTYYTPVPTVRTDGTAPAVVYFVNNNNSSITVNWQSGIPTSGSINIPSNSWASLTLDATNTGAYKIWNSAGKTFTALEIMDADATSSTYDWAITLIDSSRLTDFAGVAWAPGSLDGSRNDGPVWVTPTANTTIYVKFDGDMSDSTPTMSPCGMPFDVAYQVNALQYIKIKDPSDNDQSGMALYTCDGTTFTALYGQDASTAVTAAPSLDVGTFLMPKCMRMQIIATDNYGTTAPSTPITINVTTNDVGFQCTVDSLSVNTTNLLPPSNGTIVVNPDGTITYTPNPGFVGQDVFEYRVCSVEYSNVCDVARVYITVTNCYTIPGENTISGKVFVEQLPDDGAYDVSEGFAGGVQVDLYNDVNCDGIIQGSEQLVESTISDLSGNFRFSTINGYSAADNFDPTAAFTGNDGGINWTGNWSEVGDNNNAGSGDVRIMADVIRGGMGNAIRLGGNDNGINRQMMFSGASAAQLRFSFRRQAQTDNGAAVLVQINGSTIYTINDGNGNNNDNFYQDVTVTLPSFVASGLNTVQFITNGSTSTSNFFWIDNVELTYIKDPACFIVAVNPSNTGGAYSAASLNSSAVQFSGTGICSSNNYLGVKPNLIAADDASSTSIDVPVQINILNNDVIGQPNPSAVTIMSSPANGTVAVNPDGTVSYYPNPGYTGTDVFNYQVCSLEDPQVCDVAQVTVTISCLPSNNVNVVSGIVFNDVDLSASYTAQDTTRPGVSVALYNDINANGTLEVTDTLISTQVSNSLGAYRFQITPGTQTRTIRDEFTVNTTANQSAGTASWSAYPWTEISESDGFGAGDINITAANGLRITRSSAGSIKGAFRVADLSTALSASLSFNYRETGMDIEVGDYVDVYVANSPTAADWILVKRLTGADGNQSGTFSFNITPYISSATTIRIVTSSAASMGTGDIVDFDNIQVSYTEIPANTYLDRFNTNGANNGSNGTQSWTNNWTEILEVDGFNAGNTIVTGNQLKIAGNASNTQTGAMRSANLAGVGTAYLSFEYFKAGFDDANDRVDVEIASSALGPWTLVSRLDGPTNNSGTVYFQIPPSLLTATTTVRFVESSSNNMQTGDYVNFDNVQFSYYPPQRYIVRLVQPIPPGYTLTTPAPNPTGLHAISLSGIGQAACQKNFGLAGADLAIRKRATPEPVVAGQTLTYVITVTNNGPTNAAVTRAIDTLPAGFTPVTVTASRGTWTSPNWNIGTMTPGQVDSLVITGTVSVNQCTSLRNYATVTSNTSDPDLTNNTSDTVITTVLDQTAPTISICPPPRSFNGCSEGVVAGPVFSSSTASSTYAVFSGAPNNGTATDNCGIVSVNYKDSAYGTCPITIIRTWTIRDAAGNSTTCQQTLTVTDNVAPTVACMITTTQNVQTNMPGGYQHTGNSWNATGADNCAYTLSASLSGATNLTGLPSINGVFFNEGTTTVTWTATDNCGNTAACSFDVVVTAPVILSGTVYNDLNGLTDGTINGTGTQAGGLHAILVNSAGNTVADNATVAADGTYSFNNVPPGTYFVLITLANPAIGAAAPAITLPAGWVHTGEGLVSAGDGNVNGQTNTFTVTTASISNIDFGIQQLPMGYDNSAPGQTNPGGTIQVPVGASNFAGTDPSGGIITGMLIATFPNDITSIVINGIMYTSSTFPPGGVYIPTTPTGEPTYPITIDPMDGYVFVNIPFYVFDNASMSSIQPVKVLVPFTLLLPVRWLDFTAKAKDKKLVELNWSTAQETAALYYDVERSGDGQAFTKIGTVQALGRSDGTGEYQLNDNNPLSGTNYYRIRMQENAGGQQYSVVRMVKFAGEQQQQPIDVYPNPATTYINISFPPDWIGKDATLEIFDNNGKRVHQMLVWELLQMVRIRVDKLANGSYYLKIQSPGLEPVVKTIQVLR